MAKKPAEQAKPKAKSPLAVTLSSSNPQRLCLCNEGSSVLEGVSVDAVKLSFRNGGRWVDAEKEKLHICGPLDLKPSALVGDGFYESDFLIMRGTPAGEKEQRAGVPAFGFYLRNSKKPADQTELKSWARRRDGVWRVDLQVKASGVPAETRSVFFNWSDRTFKAVSDPS